MASGSQATPDEVPPAMARMARPHRVRWELVLGLVGLLAALTRLPLIRSPVDVSPDGCEYLGIARHLAFEHRWVSSLKWQFFTDPPVVHPALADRPPLFPLWAAGWVALSNDPVRQIWLARLGNLLLAAMVPALIYWALRAALLPAAAALTAIIFLLYPAFLRNSAQPLTEPLFLVLMFGSLGVYLRAGSGWAWALCGCLAGLAFLTRPAGLLLPLTYGLAFLTERRIAPLHGEPSRRSRDVASLAWMLVGFILPLLPAWIAIAAQTGSPFTSVLRYNYSIRHIDEGTFYGFERHFSPPWVFVRDHGAEVARLVAEQWRTMGSALGRSLQFLLPLGLFWRRGGTRGQAALAALALLNFVFHAMSWTVWGAARYLFPTYIIGMGLLLDAPLRRAATGDDKTPERASGSESRALSGKVAGHRRVRLAAGAAAAALALTLAACLEQDLRLYREKQHPFGGVHLGWAYAEAARYLAETPHGEVCASNQPWILNLLAERPTVMAPRFQDAAQLRRYLARYRPGSVVLFVTEREAGDVACAQRLVEHLWTRPSLWEEERGVLELRQFGLRGTHSPRQALLVMRVRQPGHGVTALRHAAPSTRSEGSDG